MTPFERQFETLKEAYPGSSFAPVGDGSFVVTVPDVAVSDGWNAKATTVRFVAPVQYPVSRPDCFWADGGLKLKNESPPQNTGANPIPGGATLPLIWFSWHVGSWSANADTLTTYLNVIRKRLADPR